MASQTSKPPSKPVQTLKDVWLADVSMICLKCISIIPYKAGAVKPRPHRLNINFCRITIHVLHLNN